MPRLILCRHGRTDYNAAGRFQGWLDTHLDELGRAQAAALGEFLGAQLGGLAGGGDQSGGRLRFFCSPLARARESLAPTVAALGADFSAVQTVDDLREINHGSWNGQLAADVDAAALAAWRARPHEGTAGPGGESLAALQNRAFAAFCAIAEGLAEADVAVVMAHDAVVRVILLAILGAPLSAFNAIEQANCAVNVIDFTAADAPKTAASDAASPGRAPASPRSPDAPLSSAPNAGLSGALSTTQPGFKLIAANLAAAPNLLGKFFQAAL